MTDYTEDHWYIPGGKIHTQRPATSTLPNYSYCQIRIDDSIDIYVDKELLETVIQPEAICKTCTKSRTVRNEL